jgi:hypothetical protein
MPGLFSSMSKAAAYVGKGIGSAKANWGMMGGSRGLAKALGPISQAGLGVGAMAASGAAYGGIYGAMSDNTSVLGGALAGATLGAVGTRYGGAALSAYGRGGGLRRMGRSALEQMRGDLRRGSSMFANSPVQRVGSTLKGWMSSR